MKFLEILIMTLLIAICIVSFSFGFYVSEDKGRKQQPQKRQGTTMSIQFQSYPLFTAKCTKSNPNFCEEYSVFRVYPRN